MERSTLSPSVVDRLSSIAARGGVMLDLTRMEMPQRVIHTIELIDRALRQGG
jgi:hypothetical protein